MSSTVEIAARTIGIVGIVAIVLTAAWTAAGRDRWGWTAGCSKVVGEGAYRRAIARSWVPRRAPASVVAVAGLGIAWGLVTTVVFAPGGLVFLLAPVRHEPATQVLLAMSALGAWGASISGFPLGVSLIAIGHALLTRDDDLVDRALPVAAWSIVHHACVLGAFGLFALHEREPAIAIAVAIPTALGVLHALALSRVARQVAAMPLELDREP